MKLNYKQLGPYIKVLDKRNKDLEVDLLLGVSIQKVFIPSIANTIGTDMSKYKIVYNKQFAYGPVTSRNGNKISVALLEKEEAAIVSQAYVVFEIIDHEELDPEYLMMWFRRPEFDRYARFKSHGSARETFDWDEMCEIELPIPSIEKQREIVKEYNTIVNRIGLNEELNQKLEETAQALYKHWFVDFEFPNEEGKPYKSSGGKMVYSSELDKEVPKYFDVDNLGSLVDDLYGGDWGKSETEGNYVSEVLCIRGTDIPGFKYGIYKNMPKRFILEKNLQSREMEENQIIVEISGGSPVQATGRTNLITRAHLNYLELPIICSNFCKVISLKDKSKSKYFYSHFNYLYNLSIMFTYENSTTGVKNFDINAFLEEEFIVTPDKNTIAKYNEIYDQLTDMMIHYGKEIEILTTHINLLLSYFLLNDKEVKI